MPTSSSIPRSVVVSRVRPTKISMHGIKRATHKPLNVGPISSGYGAEVGKSILRVTLVRMSQAIPS